MNIRLGFSEGSNHGFCEFMIHARKCSFRLLYRVSVSYLSYIGGSPKLPAGGR